MTLINISFTIIKSIIKYPTIQKIERDIDMYRIIMDFQNFIVNLTLNEITTYNTKLSFNIRRTLATTQKTSDKTLNCICAPAMCIDRLFSMDI